jgi:hypothetical protein
MPDTLPAGQQLDVGSELVSNNGRYHLVMQGDGNLVLYEPGNVSVWDTGTWSVPAPFGPPNRAVMQGDGNFVLYNPISWAAWATGTDGSGGDHLVVQNDRNVVIYTANGQPVWGSGTGVPPEPGPAAPAAGYPMPPQTPVVKHQRDEVGWGKFIDTDVTLYRDGRLLCSVKTENNNWTGGLRGRLLIVGVDMRGNACWVSQELQCTTRCSIPDFSCASFGRDTLSETWPPEGARIVDHVDIYQADAASFVDLRRATVDAIKAVGELAQYLGPIIAML